MGILYCAQGEQHFAEALVSLQSSMRHNSVPHIVFTDRDPAAAIAGVEFKLHPSSGHPLADKIDAMSRSPFSRTIFLDTDTYIADKITELFDLLARFDFAAARKPGYLGDDPEIPPAFDELNTGVVVYQGTPEVRQFLTEWRSTYLAWLDEPPFKNATRGGDQPALRRCLWTNELSFHVLGPEYNYRTIWPGRLSGRAKIIHGRAEDFPALVAHLNRQEGPRVFPRLTER